MTDEGRRPEQGTEVLPMTWSDQVAQVKQYVDRLQTNLGQSLQRQESGLPVSNDRLVSDLFDSQICSILAMILMHTAVLEQRVVQLFEASRTMSELVDLGDEKAALQAALLEERLEQVEYANVATAQNERLVERLAGDIMAVLAEQLKPPADSDDPPEGR